MERKNWWNGISMFLGILAAAAIIAGIGRIYYGYFAYGEMEQLQKEENKLDTETGEVHSEEEGQEKRQVAIKKLEQMQAGNIRVQIMTSDYEDDCHEYVEITSRGSFRVRYVLGKTEIEEDSEKETNQEIVKSDGEEQDITQCAGGDIFRISTEDLSLGNVLCIESDESETLVINSIERAYGTPEYEGVLYLCRNAGGIVVINEVPLETYLYSVVASEMPSSYPAEAQKAQAVCARTYAVNRIKGRETEEDYELILQNWYELGCEMEKDLADLDDSVEFQVYNNHRATAQSKAAVEETAGEILDQDEVLYYSTSIGSQYRTDLGEEQAFEAFLAEEPEETDEYGSPWLRWEVCLSEEEILENLKRYQEVALKKIGSLSITARNEQGQVQTLEIKDEDESAVIEGEYWIRKIFAPETAQVSLRDGTVVEGMSMLPSAFFLLESNAEGGIFMIRGGGYGHGIGMSQCGAAAMALDGSNYREILEYYYGTIVF